MLLLCMPILKVVDKENLVCLCFRCKNMIQTAMNIVLCFNYVNEPSTAVFYDLWAIIKATWHKLISLQMIYLTIKYYRV